MYITINLVEKVQGHDVQEYTNSHKNVEKTYILLWSPIIRYQSRDVIYPVLKGSGFVKRWGVSRTF